jgi:sugar/nucleoside kinase (ribokinase family)
VPTQLVGKVGDDLWGRLTVETLEAHDPTLVQGITVAEEQKSSYTIVIDPPGADRAFLHFPGPNRDFAAGDIQHRELEGLGLLHFGYPPLMPRMFREGGAEMAEIFRSVKQRGLTTSLDVTLPDLESEAGQLDWRSWLKKVLPRVDLFLPNLPEVLFMLDGQRLRRGEQVDGALLRGLTGQLLEMGAAVVVVKLGDQGIYLRTTDDVGRLESCGHCAPRDILTWRNRELLAPSFQIQEVRTIGAGDCAVAGFLCGLAQGMPPETALAGAAALGAINMERADPATPLPSWMELVERIRAGWPRLPVALPLPGWRWYGEAGVWTGPNDVQRAR